MPKVMAQKWFACRIVTSALVALCNLDLQRIGSCLLSMAATAPSLQVQSTGHICKNHTRHAPSKIWSTVAVCSMHELHLSIPAQ